MTSRKIMLAMAETPEQIAELDLGYEVVALCETPAGVLNAAIISALPNVTALMWGAEDLIAGLGGQASRTPEGTFRDVALHARVFSPLSLSSLRKTGHRLGLYRPGDLTQLAAEAEDAAASGFAGKACIHPSQTAVVRAAFRPSAAQVEWARKVESAARGHGVVAVDGVMIDAPLLTQARATLRRAT